MHTTNINRKKHETNTLPNTTIFILQTYSYVLFLIIIGILITSCISFYLLLHIDDHLMHDHSLFGKTSLLRSSTKARKNRQVMYFYHPSSLSSMNHKDYDNLVVPINFTQGRQIVQDEANGHVFNPKFDGDDYIEPYYAFDDDYIRHPTCKRVSWYKYTFPTCNTFHETDIMNIKVINAGYYRNVMKLNKITEELILKTIRFKRGYGYDSYEYTRMDALIMERLTSSPRIADIFGYCGTSIIQEAFVADLQSKIVSKTNYMNKLISPKSKLKIALSMSEAVADLHGYEDGIIIHDDISLSQFLFTSSYQIKLNDFNRAEIMLYDANNYCKYFNGKVYGSNRSPEEIKDEALDEKIDVWSLGNNLYSLLMDGLWIFYYLDEKKVNIQELVVNGTTSYIDPKFRTNSSYEERILVSIIEKCWIYNPNDRIDVFEIVTILKNALGHNAY